MSETLGVVALDPFELPDWLGTHMVTWTADSGLGGHLVRGTLSGAAAGAQAGSEAGSPAGPLACDLMGVDEAAPQPVADDQVRVAAHRAWQRGEVHLVAREDRVTLAVPGCGFDADRVIDALARLARAVGADANRYAVCLLLGKVAPRANGAR